MALTVDKVIHAGGTYTSLGDVYLADSNGVSFGMSNNTITASVAPGGGAAGSVIVGGSTLPLGAVVFSNSNGLAFGLNGSTITASYTVPTDYISANQSSLFQLTADMTNYLAVGYTTHTHSEYINTSQSSLFQQTSLMSDYLQTDYTTHTHSQYLTTQTVQPVAASGSNGSFIYSTLSFGNLNGLSFYTSNGSIVGSYTAAGGADGYNILAAGTQTANTSGTVVFSNANGISFGMSNNSVITASYTVPTDYISTNQSSLFQLTANMSDYLQTDYTSHTHSEYILTANSSLFQLTANMSDYLDTNYTTHTHTQLNQAFSAQGGSSSFQTLVFANGNGFTFSNNNGSVQGSYTVPTVTNSSWTVSDANSSATVGRLAFTNLNGVTLSLSTGNNGSHTIVGSHDGITQQSTQPVAASAQNGSFLFSTLNFVDTNGVSFISSTDGIRASVQTNYLTSQSNQAFSAANASSTFQTLAFQDSNGLSFSNNAGSLRMSHELQYSSNTSAITSNAVNTSAARIQALIASDATYSSGSVAFRDLNGISWQSTTGQQIQVVHGLQFTSNTSNITSNALHSSASRVFNIVAATNSTGGGTASLSSNVSFSNANNFTFYTSAGNAIVASYSQLPDANKAGTGFTSAGNNIGLSGTLNTNGLSLSATVAAQTNQTVGFYAVGNTTQNSSTTLDARTISFNGLGAASVGFSNGSIQLSVPVQSVQTQQNIQAFYDGANSISTGTIRLTNANGVTFSIDGQTLAASVATDYAASNHSHGNPTLALTNLSGTTASNSAGFTLSLSAAAPGAAAENNWMHLLGANTAGNTTASGSTIGLSAINLTLSGTNNSVVNISAPATSSLSGTGQVSISVNGSTISIGVPDGVTHSRYNEFKESPMVVGAIGQASLHVQPWLIPNLHMDRVVLHNHMSNASNSSGSFTLSQWVGLYTKTGSTLSLLASTSASTNFTGSGTAGSYSWYGGLRAFTIGWTQTLTEGMYWIGVIHRTTSGGTNHTVSQVLNSNINSNYSGILGEGSNATKQWSLGLGIYTASTTAMPASIGFTQLNGTASIALRPPSLYFVSGTV